MSSYFSYRSQKKLRIKEEKNPNMYVGVNIDWATVKFRDETHWPELLETPFGDQPNTPTGNGNPTIPEESTDVVPFSEGGDTAAAKSKRDRSAMRDHAADKSQFADRGKTHVSTLFKTKFTNSTDEPQEYTMKTEKTTHSSCTTEIENSWSKSFEMGISLKTPGEIMEANAGYSREISLTNTEGQTFEEELTWGVESQISVKAGHVAEASLVVNEKKYRGDFFIHSTVQGMVYVTFTNKRDNNALVKATGNNIADIVEWYLKRKSRINIEFNYVKVDNDVVKITTKGRCNYRFGINQEVLVTQKPI